MFDSHEVAERLVNGFNCHILNALVAERPPEARVKCYSTVLIEQDYRIRPIQQAQIQIFAQAQKDLLVRTVSLFAAALTSHEGLARLSKQAVALTKSLLRAGSTLDSHSPRTTLRGQLQRWRDQTARSHDEGV